MIFFMASLIGGMSIAPSPPMVPPDWSPAIPVITPRHEFRITIHH